MKKTVTRIGCAALALLLCGCVSFKYEGEAETPLPKARIYEDASKITTPHRVIGRAVVSGDYQNISFDKLKERLLEEAAARGADAVLITTNQVVPRDSSIEVTGVHTAFMGTGRSDSGNLNQISRDFDEGGYGEAEIFKKNKPTPNTHPTTSYRRVLRADFIRLDPAPQEAPPKADTPR